MRAEALAPDAEVFGGTAVRRQLRVRWVEGNDEPWIDLLVYVPKRGQERAPVFLGLNYGNQGVGADPGIVASRNSTCGRGEHAARWPIETILARGYGVATFHGGDVELDRHGSGCRFSTEAWKRGIRYFALKESGRVAFDDDEWGSLGAWAWGLSRVMDILPTVPGVDGRRVAVIGHSRTGKAALWAAARDERFALAVSNDSGQGGAALARRRFGETVAASYALSGIWYCRKYGSFGNRENELPVDSHLLVALMAPRPVYVASATRDGWADPMGEFLAARHADPVYALFGRRGLGVEAMPEPDRPVGETIGYHVRTGDHEITPYDWERYLDFADRRWRSDPSPP
ncbi:MAG: acetylxylan esterase [Verrucomicrobiales bacterium]|nr:acetylxylan esterase [Verrucomicrobiales bacterium]